MKTQRSILDRRPINRFASPAACVIAASLMWLVASYSLHAQPPEITCQPQGQTNVPGSTITLTVCATGTPPLAYQWRRGTVALADATNDVLVITNFQSANAGNYTVIITNSEGAVTSAVAAVRVLVPASITTQPTNFLTLSLGGSVSNRVTASGSPPPVYQWRLNGTDLPGATNALIILTNLQLSHVGEYTVEVGNTGGSITSAPAVLNVDPTFTKITQGDVVSGATDAWAGIWVDYNEDGLLDLIVAGGYYTAGGRPPLVYDNVGGGQFRRNSTNDLAQLRLRSGTFIWGDFDNDGDLDAYATQWEGAAGWYLRNDGSGRFSPVQATSAWTANGRPVYGSAGAAADYDGDGNLDLLVGHWGNIAGTYGTNSLLRGLGGGAFEVVVNSALAQSGTWPETMAWVDYDEDGDQDMFIATSRNSSQPDLLMENSGNGVFTRKTSHPLLTQSSVVTLGQAWADYDNDGDLDAFIGRWEDNRAFLYRALGGGNFEVDPNSPRARPGWRPAIGQWGDYDNDGYLDLFVAPTIEGTVHTSRLFHNRGDGTFEDVLTGSPVFDPGFYGCAWGDYDGDGFLDLVVPDGQTGINHLYRNSLLQGGNSNGWLKVRLVGTASNRSGIGAAVRVRATIGGQTFWQRRQIAAQTYESSLEAHFGLGDATIADLVRVEWPSGAVQTLSNVAPRQLLTITEEPQPRIEMQPVDLTLCQGATATFSVSATGARPLSYQWRYYVTVSSFTNIPGETSASLVLENVQPASGRFALLVSNASGSVTSRLAKVNVFVLPTITHQAIGGSALIGQSFTQSVTANGTALGYQWYFNGLPLAGKTASSLVIPSVQLTNAGDYYVVVSNACGMAMSETGRLAVGPDATFTRITTGPLVTDLGNSPSASLGDYDGDGYLDLFINRYAVGQSQLYQNQGGGTFARVTNVFSPISLGFAGSAWADFDNDGRLDLFALDYAGGLPSFFAFNNGDGSFTRLEFEVEPPGAVSVVDYNEDGWLDLYMSSASSTSVASNRLYRNVNGRQYEAVTREEVGDLLTLAPTRGNASWADYDDDGHMDVYVASITNYAGGTVFASCKMHHNEGNGRFLSVTNQVTLDAIRGFTAAWGDYNNDGRADLLVLGYNYGVPGGGWTSILYRNLGGGNFERASVGLTLPWGDIAAWGDYDNDGFLDLLITERPSFGCSLFRNNGNGTFTKVTTGPIVTTVPPALASYSANWFDYDNDGFLDLFVANGSDLGTASMSNFLHHNGGNTNAWLKVKLVGAASNRDAVGAKVRVMATFGGATSWQRREITAGEVWGGNNNPIAHFGLGDATNVATLRVEWPSGQVTELHDVAVRQHLTITEAPGLRATGFAQGAMQLQLTAHLGMSISLDTSSDLVQWTPWQTWPQTNRIMTVTDPDAGQHPQRFYKARAQ